MQKSHTFAQMSTGIFLGTILGIISFLSFTQYGGNYGCFEVVDQITGMQGYESCGNLGIFLGVFFGSVCGVLLGTTLKLLQKKQVSLGLLSAAFILPMILGLFIFSQTDINVWYLKITVPATIVLGFMGFSAIISFLTLSIVSGVMKLKNVAKK